MTFPLVEDLAAEGVPVTFTCGLLGFSPQAFYEGKRRPCSDRDWADAHTVNAIVEVHATDTRSHQGAGQVGASTLQPRVVAAAAMRWS
jgi:hypothetical protein